MLIGKIQNLASEGSDGQMVRRHHRGWRRSLAGHFRNAACEIRDEGRRGHQERYGHGARYYDVLQVANSWKKCIDVEAAGSPKGSFPRASAASHFQTNLDIPLLHPSDSFKGRDPVPQTIGILDF